MNLENIKFVKINHQHAIGSPLAPKKKMWIMSETNHFWLEKKQDNDLRKSNLTNINSFTSNTQAANDNQAITK